MSLNPTELVLDLYQADEANCFDDPEMGVLLDPPLVAVAAADDPWFERFKELIGDFHWTPAEAMSLGNAELPARSVISWCLPVAEPARAANREQTDIPSRPWAYVRTYGQEMNSRLCRAVVERLTEHGFAAVAPQMLPENRVARREGVGFSSCWSERHIAFVAGLGTFGISGGLITRRGVAHRLGSVVTDMQIAPTPRPYGDDPFAWCLRCVGGTCGACIERCPVGSIGESIAERDKDACHQHVYASMGGDRGLKVFGWQGAYGCGLCQTAVPCEQRNPTET